MFALETLVDSEVDIVSRAVVCDFVFACVVVDSIVCDIVEGAREAVVDEKAEVDGVDVRSVNASVVDAASVDFKVVSVTLVEVGCIVLLDADVAATELDAVACDIVDDSVTVEVSKGA